MWQRPVIRAMATASRSLTIRQAATKSHRCFSETPAAAVRPRRRRRKRADGVVVNSNSNSNDNDGGSAAAAAASSSSLGNKPVAVKDLGIFVVESQEFLDRVEEALRPMQAKNAVFHVDRPTATELRLRLAPGLGEYSLTVDETWQTLHFQSPLSGKYTYVLDQQSHKFVSEDDGHALEGLLVRDLIRQCNGYPDL